jgi:hypothetical protein
MDHYDIKRLALVLAVQAEIEGMKTVNQESKRMNATMPYTIGAFEKKAMDLRNLAYALNEQL